MHSWNYRHTLQIQSHVVGITNRKKLCQGLRDLGEGPLNSPGPPMAPNFMKALLFSSILPSFVHSWNYGHTLQIQSHVVGITNRRKRCQGFEYIPIHISISLVVEFQRWWVLKSKIFGQESTYSNQNIVFFEYNECELVRKCQNQTLKVDFLC